MSEPQGALSSGRESDEDKRKFAPKPEVVSRKTKESATNRMAVLKRGVFLEQIRKKKVEKGGQNIDVRLDLTKGLESPEQQQEFEDLHIVSATTLIPLLFATAQMEFKSQTDLQDLEKLNHIQFPDSVKLNKEEKDALTTLQAIVKNPSSPHISKLREEWNTWVEEGYQIAQEAEKISAGYQSGNTEIVPANPMAPGAVVASSAPSEKSPEKKEESLSPWMTAGLAIAGTLCAVGIGYHLYKSVVGKSKDEETGLLEDWLGYRTANTLKTGLFAAGGIFFFGRLMGYEGVRKWMKGLGLDVKDHRFFQFAILAAQGDFSAAWDVLKDGPDEHFEMNKRMAELISAEMAEPVEVETLSRAGKIKYDDFMSWTAQGKSAIEKTTEVIPGISFFTGGKIDPEKAKQEIVVRKYFEKHDGDIKKFATDSSTVEDVLVKLDTSYQGGDVMAAIPEVQRQMAPLKQAVSKLDSKAKQDMGDEMVQEIEKRWVDENADEIKEVLLHAHKKEVNVKPFEEAVAVRKDAHGVLLKTIEGNESPEAIAEKGQNVLEVNEKVREELNKVVEELKYKPGWETEAVTLLGTQGLTRFYGYLKRPPLQREYGKYLWTKYFFDKPIGAVKTLTGLKTKEAGKRLIGREFKDAAAPLEDIKAQKAGIAADVAEATRARDAYKKQYGRVAGADTYEGNRVDMNDKKVALLEHDVKINESFEKIRAAEDELAKLGATVDAARKAHLEGVVRDNKSIVQGLQQERFVLQGDYMEVKMKDQRMGYERDFGKQKGTIEKEHFQQMDEMADDLIAHRKQIDRMIASKMAEAEQVAAKGKVPQKLAAEINALFKQKVRLEVGNVDNFNSLSKVWYQRWTHRMKATSGLYTGKAGADLKQVMDSEANQLRRSFTRTIHEEVEQAGSGVSKGVVKTLQGKAIFYVPCMILGTYMNYDKQANIEVIKAMKQTAIDILPVVSTASDFYSAATGEEYITGRKLDVTDRSIRAVFGVGSALCDFTAVAKYALKARVGYEALKGGKTIKEGIKISEALKASEKAFDAGKKAMKEIDSIDELRKMAKTGRWITQIGMGGALGVMGYHMVYQPLAERDLSAEAQAILADAVQNFEDIEPPKIDYPLL